MFIYSCCVYASYSTGRKTQNCKQVVTPTSAPPPATMSPQSGGSGEDTGIIVGAVVGAVVLLILLAAIAYLVIVRRKPAKQPPASHTGPVQPRTFTKSELPSMAPEARTFTKPKKPPRESHGHNNNGFDATDQSMQVVAISDGHTSNGSIHGHHGSGHFGRADRFLPPDNNGYKDMSGMKQLNVALDTKGMVSHDPSGLYENDHGPLPPTPSTPGSRPTSADNIHPPSYHSHSSHGGGGYYNNGFHGDNYDQVDNEFEVAELRV